MDKGNIKTAILIANPVSGRASKAVFDEARLALESHGFSVKSFLTEKRGDAETLARDALSLEPDLFVIAGGDGTINEAINGLAGSKAIMAVLPLGTANVMAHELALPFSIKGAIEAAATGTPRSVSLGEITAECGTRWFCLMAGAGFDAEAVFRVSGWLKGLAGKLAYIVSGIGVALRGKSNELKVEIDGSLRSCNHVIVSNARKYAGRQTLAPDADISVPGFEVTLIKGSGLGIAMFALALLAGLHKRLRFVETVMGKEVSIHGQAHIQIDGDYFGQAPARITARGDMLRIVS
ncbi:MAG: diacylglycerol kinase family lipid kinase [Thermodesulfovibrionales bacterium]|nr:diacylglycerol kinase family lipid kinase [Thermodesulfovibrionales bacterium]